MMKEGVSVVEGGVGTRSGRTRSKGGLDELWERHEERSETLSLRRKLSLMIPRMA